MDIQLLTNRSQRVMVGNELGDVAKSSSKSLEQGLSLFTWYSAFLEQIALQKHFTIYTYNSICTSNCQIVKLPICHWNKAFPQGSTLGPILFNLFMSPHGGICRAQGIRFA